MVKILVIDDKEDIRIKLQLILEAEGFEVMTVAGPSHATVTLRNRQFDIALVDLNDPFDSSKGQEALLFLKGQFRKSNDCLYIPMSAWPSGELMSRALTLGAKNFIEKPIKNRRVLQVIRQELAIRQLAAENQKLQQSLSKFHNQTLPMMTLEEAEIRLISQALAQSGQNVVKAAKLLGLTKSSLYRRLEKYGLSKPSEQPQISAQELHH